MPRLIRNAGVVVLGSCLGACALTAVQQTNAATGAEGAPVQMPASARPSFSPQVFYQLLVAEVAVQRGEYALAAKQYKSAANETRDPKIIERAMRLAAFVQAKPDMKELARLWSKVAPGAVEPHQVLAVLLMEQGDVAGAAAQLEQLYKVKPDFDPMQVAVILARMPDKKTAAGVMASFMKTRQQNPDALFAQAHFASRIGEPDQAASALDRALKLRPNWGAALVMQTQLLLREGETERALEVLSAALKRGVSDEAVVRYSYGRQLVDAGRYQEALEQFELLQRSDPDNSELLYIMGVTSAQLKKYDDAERYFTRLVELGERPNEVAFQMGQLMDIQRRNQEALEWYGRVKEGALMMPAQMRMAAVLANLQRYDEALTLLEAVDADNLNDRLSVTLMRGDVLFRAKRYDEATAMYEEALASFPEDARLLYAYSLVAERKGRLDLAESALRSVLMREPENVQALNALGYTLADRTDRYQEALGYIEAALKLHAEDPAILDSMGWVQYKLGNNDKALSFLRKALDKMYDPEIAAHLGEVLWKTGARDEALKLWRDALEKAPGHETVLETLKRHGQ